MEYAKKIFFKIKHNTKLDKLEIRQDNFINKIKKHKFITTVTIAFVMFSIINITMIYSFIKILQNV